MERASKWLALLSVGALLAGVAATPASAAPATDEYVVLTKKAGFSAQGLADLAQLQGQLVREQRVLTDAQADALRSESDVLAVVPDVKTQWIEPSTVSAQADSSTKLPWGLDRIDQRSKSRDGKFNTKTYPGDGTVAIVIDSGVTAVGNQFGDRLLDGYDWVDGDSDASDCDGHGTHVAGTIASRDYGVATSSYILPLRVLNCSGAGYASDVLESLLLVSLMVEDEPSLVGHLVVNLSLSGDVTQVGEDAAGIVEDAITDLVKAGVPVVVAAGNDGASVTSTTPARSIAPVVVGATTATDSRASFSNYGSSVDIFAPGVGIASIVPSGAVKLEDGTSMAAPHVTGTILRSLERKPATSAATVVKRVLSEATTGTVTDLKGSAGRLVYVPTKPNTPTSVKATRSNSKHTVKLTWKAPTAVDGFAVTGYVVERAGKKVTLKNTARSYTWKSIKPGTKTTVSVRAISAKGTGAAKSVTATMLALPGKPKSVKAKSGSKKDKSVSVIATWKKPTTGGGKISGYVVTAERKSDGKKKTVTVSASARKATIKGLKKGNGYVVTVKAKNAAGKGSSSKKSSKAIAR